MPRSVHYVTPDVGASRLACKIGKLAGPAAPTSTGGTSCPALAGPVSAPWVRVGFTVVNRESGGFFTENGGPSTQEQAVR